MQHLDEGTIHAWLDGALAGDDAAVVARHVAECRDCAALVAEARGMIAATSRIVSALDDVPGGVIPAPRHAARAQHSMWRRLRFTPARAALAATLLLTAGTLFASRHTQSPKDSVTLPSPAPTAAPAASAPPIVQVPARKSASAVSDKAQPRSIEPVQPSKAPVRAGASSTAQVADAAAAAVAAPAAPPRAETKAADANVAMQRAAIADSLVVSDTATASRRRAFSKVQQLEGVAATGAFASRAQQPGVQGCYELHGDSANTLRGIPLRFALEHAAGTTDYVVRAVSPDSRLDSVVPGGSWRPFAGERATVSFSGSPERQAVVLQFSATASVAQASAGGRLVNVGVQRLECRP